MLQQGSVDFGEPLEDRAVGCHLFAHTDERPDDEDAHLDCALATQDVCCHQCAVLCESPRPESRVSVLLGTYRNLRQVHILLIEITGLRVASVCSSLQIDKLRRRELKGKLSGKATSIALKCLVEASGRDAVQSRKVGIQHDAASAYQDDERLSGPSLLGHVHSTLHVLAG